MEYVSPESCLLPGYPLQLELLDDLTDAPCAGIYPSMVIALEPGVFYADIPKADDRRIEFPIGTPMRAVSLQEDALYSFDTQVTGYVFDIPVALCLAPPETVLRSQRRETVRVPTDLYARIGADGEDLGVKLRDIASGGVSFFCAKPLSGSIEMALNMAGADQDWLFTKMLVRRVIPVKSEYIIACSFTDLSRKDQERVVAYLYRRQRQLRQRQTGNL
jgi:c-di-GMP-binding flagellar brake protein YcgR